MRFPFINRLLPPVVIILLVILLLPDKPNVPTSSSLRQEITWALPAGPQTFDPAQALDLSSRRILSNVFEGLVRFSPTDRGAVQPALAQSWKVSNDGLTWTFTLRPGVRFHDGTPCDAAAVVKAINTQRNAEQPYAGFIYAPVDRVTALDRRTVRFDLNYPYAPFIGNLAMLQAAVTGPKGEDGIPTGTGAYQVAACSDQEVTLHRASSYWGTKPRLSKIKFIVIPDAGQRITQLSDGRVDAADDPRIALAPPGAPYQVLTEVSNSLGYLGFYTNKAPFDNETRRRAVATALDVPALVDEVFPQGDAAYAKTLLPPGLLGYAPEFVVPGSAPSPTPNQDNDGFSFTLITYQDRRPYAPSTGTVLARKIAEQLAASGIRVQVQSYPWETYKQALANQEGDAFLYGWVSDNNDPDNFLYNLLATSQIPSGLNLAHYSNRQADTLLAKAQRENDPQERARLYQAAQDIIISDTPWIPLTYGVDCLALHDDLQGVLSPAPEVPLLGLSTQGHR